MIKSYANELEHDGEMDLHEISKHITQVLKGYVTDRYVQQCLKEKKYKDSNRSKIGSIKGRNSSANNNLEDHLENVKKDIGKVLDVGQKQGLSVGGNLNSISLYYHYRTMSISYNARYNTTK